jgi:D-alanyl-D-alanine carboxypeptidase (penicillin-binding protein 5/6)
VALVAGLVGFLAQPAAAIETPARHALLVDHVTGAVLLEKDAEAPMAPASMSKLMTVYMVFLALEEQGLTLGDTFEVSEKAWKMGGSKMFVEVGKRVRVGDLLNGVIIQSGNDACIVLAEGLAGTEEAFAEEMNAVAARLGLRDSHFTNASGWPHPEHVMSAWDLVRLSQRLITDFPEYYKLFKVKEFTYNKIKQGNRNPLLYNGSGADGLKTGHTRASGYGLVASAKRKDRRLILVVNGLDSVNARSRESSRLLGWAFRQFSNHKLFGSGDEVGKAQVWLGTEDTVPLVLAEPLTVTIPRKARKEMKVTISYDGPVAAPIAEGTAIATLRVSAKGLPTVEKPLLAGRDVERRGPLGRLWGALTHVVLGAGGAD